MRDQTTTQEISSTAEMLAGMRSSDRKWAYDKITNADDKYDVLAKIKNMDDLRLVINTLTPEQRKSIYENFKNRLSSDDVKKMYDYVTKHCTPEQRKSIQEEFPENDSKEHAPAPEAPFKAPRLTR